MKGKILKILNDPRLLGLYFLEFRIARIIPDAAFIKLKYRLIFRSKLDLKNPKTYSEKLQWLKLHDRKTEYIQMVDKYEVRRYISETIGNEYLIPLIGIYDNAEQIDWDSLPQKFVMKCTHSSGSNIICTDKDKLDIEDAKGKLNQWLKENWFWFGREWPYKNVRPRIICEHFISDDNNTPNDYKVFCFSGKAKLIALHCDRFGNHSKAYYDENWNRTSIKKKSRELDHAVEKPLQLDKMVSLSEYLASDMYHARIDWYLVGGKLFFGEITFFSSSGFVPFFNKEDDYLIGSWINLRGV